MYESVYRQAQATLPTLVVSKISHVCTFCLYGLKDGNCIFYFDVFDVLISLVIVEESVFVRARETQLSAILWSRGAILL